MIQQSPIKIWRKFNNRYRLLGNECVDCKNRHYPPVQVCKKCHGTNLVEYQYPNTGKLISWSKVMAVSKGFEAYAPYIIAIVELEGGERITTQIVDVEYEDLKYEMKLKAVFRKMFVDGNRGVIHYAIKFKPA